jgi:hypothetical protein
MLDTGDTYFMHSPYSLYAVAMLLLCSIHIFSSIEKLYLPTAGRLCNYNEDGEKQLAENQWLFF